MTHDRETGGLTNIMLMVYVMGYTLIMFFSKIWCDLNSDGLVSQMYKLGDRQSKNVVIIGCSILVHPNQTWALPVKENAIIALN